MKTNREMLLVDPETQTVTGLEIGTKISSPRECESSKEYFDQKNKELKDQLEKAQQEKHKTYFRNLQLGELGKYIIVRVKFIPDADEVTAANLGRLVYLSTYCDYNNRLMLTENRTMSRRDLPEVLNLGERKTRDFIHDMDEYIKFNDDGIYISDDFLYRGEKKERKYNHKMKLFNKSVQDLYKSLKPKNHKYFGFIIQLLPYVNRKYNIICKNPDEVDIDKIESMSLTDIAVKLNYEKSNSGKLLEILTGLLFDASGYQQSACSIIYHEGNGQSGYDLIFNPRLLYIGEDYRNVEAFCKFFPNVVKSVRKNRIFVPIDCY